VISSKHERHQSKKLKFMADLAKGRVLDIGCAVFPNTFLDLNDKVNEVYLLDITKPQKPVPKKTREFILHDLNSGKLPFPNEYFDTVIAADVIEHLESPIIVIKEINRILKPKGLFLLSLPSQRNVFEILKLLLTGTQIYFPEHKFPMTRRQTKFWLENAGFSVKKIIGYSVILPFPNREHFVALLTNTKLSLPEIITWQNIYIAEKVV